MARGLNGNGAKGQRGIRIKLRPFCVYTTVPPP